MTCRWSISSKLAVTLTAHLTVAILGAATVGGRVELIDSTVRSVVKNKDYSGVVVWLEPVTPKPQPLATGTHRILQKNKRFVPHVSVIPVGTTVDLPNLDPIFHNAFSNFAGQPFDTGLYPPGGTQKVRFRRPGVVRVFCNIHSSMSAVIVVLNSSHFAASGPDGSFTIDGVEPGEYFLNLWHERASADRLKALVRKVVVPAEGLQVGVQRISESGYLQLPHKNKYGREYGPEPTSVVPYGGK